MQRQAVVVVDWLAPAAPELRQCHRRACRPFRRFRKGRLSGKPPHCQHAAGQSAPKRGAALVAWTFLWHSAAVASPATPNPMRPYLTTWPRPARRRVGSRRGSYLGPILLTVAALRCRPRTHGERTRPSLSPLLSSVDRCNADEFGVRRSADRCARTSVHRVSGTSRFSAVPASGRAKTVRGAFPVHRATREDD